MSPVWKRGSMLVPWVPTYVVAPPSDKGQKAHTAASISATAALMLAALGAVFIGRHRSRVRVGRPVGRPTRSGDGLGAADRQADRLELVERDAVALACDHLSRRGARDRARVVGGHG